MTAPTSSTVPLPQAAPDPPRRTFGSFSKSPPAGPNRRPNSSSSSHSATPTGSSTYLPLAVPSKPEATRTRSASSASSDAFASAADKAQAWLHTWAPKGEGRSREFFANTLNGVATVASTVSSGIGGTVNNLGVQLREDGFGQNFGTGRAAGSRPSSYAGSPPESINDSMGRLAISPPGPTHTASTPALGSQQMAAPIRRIPQPSNLARLGGNEAASLSTGALNSPAMGPTRSTSSSSAPSTAPSGPGPSAPTTASTSTLPRSTSVTGTLSSHSKPHGSSHLNPHSRSISHPAQTQYSHSRSPSGLGMARTPSRSSSTTAGAGAGLTRSAGMPYKIGFQPAGVKTDRTGEFMDDRRRWAEERDKEEGRLGRRWAKLVELHFNPTIPIPNTSAPSLPRSSSSSFSLSSKADRRSSLLSMEALDSLRPREVWKGLKGVAQPPGQGEEARKRAVEQTLVKWEDDSEVKKCRICLSTFSLSNRKHHCRLCGRIVCSLPPTPSALLAVQVQLFAPADPSAASNPSTADSQAALPPGTRRDKCSLLLVADWKTGRGEEVDEGFVGWMTMQDGEEASGEGNGRAQGRGSRRVSGVSGAGTGTGAVGDVRKERRKSRASIGGVANGASGGSGTSGTNGALGDGDATRGIPLPQQPKEVQVKGVRVCRECWAIVSRKQKMADRQRVTTFAKLYQMLRKLQSEIEDVMPEFEEQMEELTNRAEPTDPGPEMLSTHKSLLTLFAQYEHLSKRLSSLPAPEGSSQSQLQSAVARVSAGFLAKEMVKLQALPKVQKLVAERKRRSMMVLETTLAEQLGNQLGQEEEGEEDTAMMLQPLLEQESQLESYIADANAQRKYEDSRALTAALADIRAEIARVTQRAM
ncbi:hypothetical protein JCM24511_05664 [Saitozyma sp. JCM 24511]|nr:hypothetical protein JCM24511_05664 [Saitozyma sp. JCM 24511]